MNSDSSPPKGIGPKGSSLLNKLGLKSISQMSEQELLTLVNDDRVRRVTTRAAGRIKRIASDKPAPKVKLLTLESSGLAPELIEKLRSSGRSDSDIIAQLKEKGIL